MRFSRLGDWLSWQETLHSSPIDLGLERVVKVLGRLELPISCVTLTVGGTNGKGSTVAMLDAILRAEGYRVGTYTSPHILAYNERICLNGIAVSDEMLVEAFQRVDEAREDVSLSFFEFGTLAALVIFNLNQVDVQILEVGLGGRLDAVNAVDADAAIISSIDLDHESWLGTSREAIALEKAGIFRADRPGIVGDHRRIPALEAHALAAGVPLLRSGIEFQHGLHADPEDGWWWEGKRDDVDERLNHLPNPALPGAHQYRNASAVIQCLSAVHARLPVSIEAICRGLSGVSIAGRFQHLVLRDVRPQVYIDVAHNPAAAEILAMQLVERFPGKRIEAIFSIMRDKDISGVISATLPYIDHWHLVPLDPIPRAATSEQMRDVFTQMGAAGKISIHDSVDVARQVVSERLLGDDIMIVFGSFFLVSAFLQSTLHLNDQALSNG